MEANRIANGLLADLGDVASENKLEFIRRRVLTIEDDDERALVEACILIGIQAGPQHSKPLHVIVLVHGIRTQGVWQNRVAAALKKYTNVRPVIVGFPYFDLISFWLPFFFRRGPMDRVEREIRGIMKDNPGANISVLAHSFGTYIISQLLLRRPDIQFYRLLLCGAIIDRLFTWDGLRSFPVEGVVNDVGTRDRLPAIAKMVSWGYGSSGTFGFRTHKVTDRYFDIDHSDFFTDQHIEKHWLPYLIDGKIIESSWDYERPTPPWILSIMEVMPLKSVGVPLLFFGIYKMFSWITSVC